MKTLKYCRTALQFLFLLTGTVILLGQQARAESCEIRLGQTELDFGEIRPVEASLSLDPRHLYMLDTRYVTLHVHCPTSSKLMLVLNGENMNNRIRFGAQGQLQVRLSNALLDGHMVDLAVIRLVGDPPEKPAEKIDVAPGDLIMPVSAGLAAEGSLLSLQIEISPGLVMDEFKTQDHKTLEGHLRFEVREH